MKTLLAFIIYGLFFVPLSLYADVSFRFRYYTIENGLSSNQVNALLQDKKGYIWIGTDKGLNRYDGKNFVYYQKKNNDKHQLGDNIINALYETSDNNLWIGTFSGLYIYDYRTDLFSLFEEKTADGVKINSSISHINQDKEGIFWISTRGQGVFSFDPATELLKQYELLHSQGHIYSALVDYSNNIWLAGMSSTYLLDKEKDDFEVFYSPDNQSIYATALYEDATNNLWIGTWENGLLKIDKERKEYTGYLDPGQGKGILHIHSIMEYTPEVLLIGSDQGLAVFNTITGTYKEYNTENKNNDALSNIFVYPLMKDHEDGIWIGTTYGGINYIPPNCGQFEGYTGRVPANRLLSGDIISCFSEDENGLIWIGSKDRGISCFSPETQQFIDYPGRSNTYHLHANDLCMDGEILWIASYAEGLNSLNTRTGSIIRHTSELPDYYIYSLLRDTKDRMWIGSGQTIYLYENKRNQFTPLKKINALVVDIAEDAEGKIWFATLGKGIFGYEPENEIWSYYDQQSGIPINIVNHICVDKRNHLWIGTGDGLCLYEKEKDTFSYIPLPVPSENIYCILDGGNNLWITTDKGLIQYNHENNSIQTFTKSDGLQSDAFISGAGLKTRYGKLFMGTINGFNTFYPHKILHDAKPPEIVLTGLELFNENVPVDDKGILTSRIDYMENIHLSHDENFISILYAALSYNNPEKNNYAYKLEGFDKHWNHIGDQTKATYTNLPTGEYTFHVKAFSNDIIRNEGSTSIRIVVHPPFYLSPPFKIIYFILITVSILCILHLLLYRKEKKYVKEIEILNANKDKEIHNAKIDFFTTIAHEIRTPVSLILGPLEAIKNTSVTLPAIVEENLETINRNGQRLLSLINQLLDFRKVEDKKMKICFRYYSLFELLEAECKRFQSSMQQRTVQFRVRYPAPDFMVAVDKEAFTKVISNLLSNACKYTKDTVELSCRIDPEKSYFVIQVTDNGEGIDPEELAFVFKPFYQKNDSKPGTGLGLSIAKDIVRAHHGMIEIESKVGEYTSFIVTLPIDQSLAERQENEEILQPQPSESLKKELVRPATGKPTLLIVDDNEEMLQFLGNYFKTQYHVIKALDGSEALELLKTHQVVLIISDWMMPHTNGIELCKIVRSNMLTSHIPFILLTAKTEVQAKLKGLDEGADDYIEKPFSLTYVATRIRNLIEQRELLREKFSRMPAIPLNSVAGNATDEKFLIHLNEIIESNISNPDLSVDFLAEQLCISRSGLYAKIKGLTNTPPNELIQIIRLKKAASLLLENHHRINEVCYTVGFKDPSYFSKCFQKQFGVKPGAYAKEYSKPNK